MRTIIHRDDNNYLLLVSENNVEMLIPSHETHLFFLITICIGIAKIRLRALTNFYNLIRKSDGKATIFPHCLLIYIHRKKFGYEI